VTKQITAAERAATFTTDSKPVALPSKINHAPRLAASTAASTQTRIEASPPSPAPQSDRERLKVQWEKPSDAAREITSLSLRWAKELGCAPFEVDWERIFALERRAGALVWTARSQGGAMVGYLAVTFTRGMFINKFFARIEAGYLAPEWREGLMGFRYIKSIVPAIDAIGKFDIEWETNDEFEPDANGRARLATLLERMGFVQVGTVMSRRK
jgi:hypothetical protein